MGEDDHLWKTWANFIQRKSEKLSDIQTQQLRLLDDLLDSLDDKKTCSHVGCVKFSIINGCCYSHFVSKTALGSEMAREDQDKNEQSTLPVIDHDKGATNKCCMGSTELKMSTKQWDKAYGKLLLFYEDNGHINMGEKDPLLKRWRKFIVRKTDKLSTTQRQQLYLLHSLDKKRCSNVGCAKFAVFGWCCHSHYVLKPAYLR
mmetsp:Transcript_781/g.1763  ORF Transcript_781/g.1763 Transcript_781/m.1763 type:complete len:202 (+) Transcript_781:625-1230(+)